MGYLAGLSQGWTDDSVAMYAAEIEALDDYEAALAGAQTVMRSWKDTRRPPLALLIDAYNAEKRRRDESLNRFAVGQGRVVPVEQGLIIAWREYASQCKAEGREPNRQMFAGWAKRVGG